MTSRQNQPKSTQYIVTAGVIGTVMLVGYQIYQNIKSDRQKPLTIDQLSQSVVDNAELRAILKDEELLKVLRCE